MKISKVKLYRNLFITSGLLNFGFILNSIAIKSNNVWMPVSYPKSMVNMYYLTDIFPIPFTNYFFSVGDVVIFIALLYAFYWVIKRDFVTE